jgi:hypothetical protein
MDTCFFCVATDASDYYRLDRPDGSCAALPVCVSCQARHVCSGLRTGVDVLSDRYAQQG